MNSKMAKSDLSNSISNSYRDWIEIESGLNESRAEQEQVERFARAMRFEWSCASSPKHD